MVKVHELKVLPEYYLAISEGRKMFELRKDDRGFEVGDKLRLCEWDGEVYSGRSLDCKITYILKEFPGLEADYVILGLILDGRGRYQQVRYAKD